VRANQTENGKAGIRAQDQGRDFRTQGTRTGRKVRDRAEVEIGRQGRLSLGFEKTDQATQPEQAAGRQD